MNQNWWITAILLLGGSFLLAVSKVPAPERSHWQQGVRYRIVAELDTLAKRLNGDMQIFYQNNSPDTLSSIFLQVPSNAFHDEDNTAMREMKRFSGGSLDFDQNRGYPLTIQSLQFLSIGERTEFPLQAYDFSDTILDLTLPYSLAPGDTLTLGLNFFQDFSAKAAGEESKIPTDFILWFPRLAVYDAEGWHAEPFHFMMQSSDIYSEFADMDIRLTVPGNYIVAASGEVIGGDPGWRRVAVDTALQKDGFEAWHDSTRHALLAQGIAQGTRQVRFKAHTLHDFIWSASPDFLYYEQKIAGKEIHFLYKSKQHSHWLEKMLEQLPPALNYLAEHFGAYPLHQLTVVRASHRNYAVPGMALFQYDSYFELAYEFSSIYFPGLVGTNGVKESWLASGLQVYMGKSFSEKMHGPRGYEMDLAQEDMNWLERQYPLPSLDEVVRNLTHLYNASGQNEPIAKEIYEYHDPIGALFNVYVKSDIFYEMLRYVVGDAAFKQSLRQLVAQYTYMHITEKDLRVTFEEVSGQDLDWFFEQWLRATPTIDYSKGKVKKTKRDDNTWITEVELKRKGDGIMPLDVALELANGEKVVQRWDGRAEETTLIFETIEKPKSVNVDPDDRIMDSNRLNNAKPRLEIRPDLPLLKYIHMPNDAILVLWRPLLGYNGHDSVRFGARARSSYRAFYHNLTLEFMVGTESGEFDGKFAYSHPLSRQRLLNRYHLMVRKNEGRFEADAHLSFNGSKGILSGDSGRHLEIGINYSRLLNDAYTFRDVESDTGTLKFDEWEDANVLVSYLETRAKARLGHLKTEGQLSAEVGLPGGNFKFTKLSSRINAQAQSMGFACTLRGNLATSWGPDRLPLQDKFRAEGATARERFRNDILKTGDALLAFSRRFVEGGGFLRGYTGQPLPAEKYATVNVEIATARSVFLALKPFAFYDTGRIWTTRNGDAFTRSDAGFGISFLGNELDLFGGNLALFADLSAKLVFPIWISDPLPGEDEGQFRWYFTLGKGL